MLEKKHLIIAGGVIILLLIGICVIHAVNYTPDVSKHEIMEEIHELEKETNQLKNDTYQLKNKTERMILVVEELAKQKGIEV